MGSQKKNPESFIFLMLFLVKKLGRAASDFSWGILFRVFLSFLFYSMTQCDLTVLMRG